MPACVCRQETLRSVMDVDKPDQLADIIAANVLIRLEDRQAILEKLKVKDRLEALCGILVRETELADVEKQVQARIKKQIEKNQKDYYLREQIKAIQTELGDKDGTDVEDLRERLEKTPLNDEAREKAEKELERLSRMAPGTPEIGVSPYVCGVDSRPALGQDHAGQPGPQTRAPRAGGKPLRVGKGEGAHH